MRFTFSCMAQIKVYTRPLQLKCDIHITTCFIYADKADGTFKIFFITINRYISVFVIGRYTKSCTCNDVFRIFCNKRRRMISPTIGKF